MINGLDLFSGIGGITIALEGIVMPVAYCEQDPFCQAVLLSRMSEGKIPLAPIWDDVRTLKRKNIDTRISIDFVSGGFPCQNVSVAGDGRGLDGEQSGLYRELRRIVSEFRPSYVFMENVPALTLRGLEQITMDFVSMGYDLKWTIVSAAELGAVHLRERIWILAHSDLQTLRLQSKQIDRSDSERFFAFNGDKRRPSESSEGIAKPRVYRNGYGLSDRSHRDRALGNAVVPQAARKAFMKLIGIETSGAIEIKGGE